MYVQSHNEFVHLRNCEISSTLTTFLLLVLPSVVDLNKIDHAQDVSQNHGTPLRVYTVPRYRRHGKIDTRIISGKNNLMVMSNTLSDNPFTLPAYVVFIYHLIDHFLPSYSNQPYH